MWPFIPRGVFCWSAAVKWQIGAGWCARVSPAQHCCKHWISLTLFKCSILAKYSHAALFSNCRSVFSIYKMYFCVLAWEVKSLHWCDLAVAAIQGQLKERSKSQFSVIRIAHLALRLCSHAEKPLANWFQWEWSEERLTLLSCISNSWAISLNPVVSLKPLCLVLSAQTCNAAE